MSEPAITAPSRGRSMRVDAHQHFWHYSPEEYGWIEPHMASLRCDRLPEHLAPLLLEAEMHGVVSVQARQTQAETDWLLELAEQWRWILGVVGWAPIAHPCFAAELERLRSNPLLKGLRHVVQAEPDPDFLLRNDFDQGIRSLRDTGLVYDLLLVENQLPQGIRFVDRHPNQAFVLDHLAKPRIASGVADPWRSNLRELGRRQHVYCKLSGMVTEARWDSWTPEDLLPYVEVALEAFGPARIMAGSDWPVCTVAASYQQWIATLGALLADLSEHEQERIFGGTAVEAYKLEVRP